MKHFVLLILLLTAFLWRFLTIKTPNYPSGTRIRITATLKEEPKLQGAVQKFVLSGIPVTAWKYPEYQYGDRLVVEGIVKNNGLEMPVIEKLEVGGGKLEFGSVILEVRKNMDQVFRKNLPEPEASLLSGITLGLKSNLPADFYKSLKNTGTMHIVVASGMNVALVSGTMFSLLLLVFSRKKSVILSIILIWFYVVLAGGEIPVVRAGIMASAVLLSQLVGREVSALRALGLSAAIIVFVNPTSLNDIGFQLSFAATLGIVMLSKKISSSLRSLPETVKNDLGQTLAAQIFTLPIILSNFNSYSVLSPLVNLLVIWPLVWILRLGLVAGFVGLIIPTIGGLICLLILPLLTYFVKVVELFSR